MPSLGFTPSMYISVRPGVHPRAPCDGSCEAAPKPKKYDCIIFAVLASLALGWLLTAAVVVTVLETCDDSLLWLEEWPDKGTYEASGFQAAYWNQYEGGEAIAGPAPVDWVGAELVTFFTSFKLVWDAHSDDPKSGTNEPAFGAKNVHGFCNYGYHESFDFVVEEPVDVSLSGKGSSVITLSEVITSAKGGGPTVSVTLTGAVILNDAIESFFVRLYTICYTCPSRPTSTPASTVAVWGVTTYKSLFTIIS